MMADVDVADVELEDGMISVYAPNTEFYKAKTALLEAFPEINFEMEEITFVPQNMVEVSGEDVAQFDKFIAALEDCDDVQNVYHNAEIIE